VFSTKPHVNICLGFLFISLVHALEMGPQRDKQHSSHK
jgi:hypothetical protein